MKTSTKLVFKNKETSKYIEEFFLGGSYTLYYTKEEDTKEFYILRNDVKYYLLPEYYSYVYSEQPIKTSDGYTVKWKILPIYDLHSLKQNLEARCSIIKGDALYNIRLGIPIGLPLQDTKLSILNTINNTYGVQGSTVIRNYIRNGKYVMDVQVQSNLGDVTITVG